MLGFEFDRIQEPFSIYNLLQAIGVVNLQMMESVINTEERYEIYLAAIGVAGVIMNGTTYFFDFRDKNS